MATTTDITIEKGRTGTITVTVTGIDDWTDLLAKFYAAPHIGADPVISLTGTITPGSDEVEFEYLFTTTSELEARDYVYEVVVYAATKLFIKNTNNGTLTILGTIKTDPTT